MGEPAVPRAFLNDLRKQWTRLMSGTGSILFTMLSFVAKTEDQRFIFLVLAIAATYSAAFSLWKEEREKVARHTETIQQNQREILALQHTRKSEIRDRLMRHAREINDAISASKITGPYAQALGIRDSAALLEFNREATATLDFVNYLRAVYYEREILGDIETDEALHWAKHFISPWIASDRHRLATWHLFKQSHDLGGRGFVDWVKGSLPE